MRQRGGHGIPLAPMGLAVNVHDMAVQRQLAAKGQLLLIDCALELAPALAHVVAQIQ